MLNDKDGDDFFWFQGIGWISRVGGKGKILEVEGWIQEAFTRIVQKGNKGINLLVPWLRASLYYHKKFSEIEKTRRAGLWEYCGFMWDMKEK